MDKDKWILIENFSQHFFIFNTLKELKEFAKKNKLDIKKSRTDFNGRTYYTL